MLKTLLLTTMIGSATASFIEIPFGKLPMAIAIVSAISVLIVFPSESKPKCEDRNNQQG